MHFFTFVKFVFFCCFIANVSAVKSASSDPHLDAWSAERRASQSQVKNEVGNIDGDLSADSSKISSEISRVKAHCIEMLPALGSEGYPFDLNHTNEQILARLEILECILQGKDLELSYLQYTFDLGESYHEWIFEHFFGKPFIWFIFHTNHPSNQTMSYALQALNAHEFDTVLNLEQLQTASYLFWYLDINTLQVKGSDDAFYQDKLVEWLHDFYNAMQRTTSSLSKKAIECLHKNTHRWFDLQTKIILTMKRITQKEASIPRCFKKTASQFSESKEGREAYKLKCIREELMFLVDRYRVLSVYALKGKDVTCEQLESVLLKLEQTCQEFLKS